ncbi:MULTISPECIES: 4-hydroxythreonine-4-phosphate dehydrogenase PdxA [unclassified Imperialibacter]|uniref:4-hydroxythreonine-4-phosphate dehydrogenase PdxA n=1 Tax=unclassified Imperialibacter TaxID=2629706 RepID=UPI00125BEBAA|nr:MULTISPECIES: 4-hydroxythreonine-4-phosphate dehydrogenase PdxA [unclassified Imperialibacter]CAD5278430.1 4-hydroxythreonine-4-phosphate dehydrogenase [Imperialibacter sp. 89]CAD5292561.1 4-hydroxythreonine-4-phosphate dehydrogenase [Imperialibacter sp. 75]VVS99656.1 4-hydroxythreonine-4-phosphate dehydrogenase [Imperialibacter sp. EC-SDR9]
MDKSKKNKPVVGITLGDINGIGPEVIIKALEDSRILKFMTPVIYGSSKVVSYYRKALDLSDFNYHQIKDLGQLFHRKVNVYNLWEETVEIKMGEENETGGKYAFLSLKAAVADLKDGKIDAVVTAPISKNNIQSEEFKFPGHTEYLAETFGVKDHLMLMAGDKMKIGLVTGHIPLKAVVSALGKELILKKLSVLDSTLKNDFGIKKPRIAVLGLNPHAGENGLLGNEERDVISPVLKEWKDKGNLVFGPFPSDGFFGTLMHAKYDGVLAMYHDQALIPFKTLCFETGVNYTAGLPAVRTSPDHGTAYSLVGKNEASETSMREAIFMAADIVKQRRVNDGEETED